MKRSRSFAGVVILLLSLLASCKEKRIEKVTYGEFLYESTDWERKKFFWPGYDHLDSEHRMFYKGEEIDFEKLAPDYLKEKTDFMEPLSLSAALPTFYHRNTAVYIMLDAGLHYSIGVLTTKENGELTFIPLINKTLDTFSEPYFSFFQMDSIGDQKVLMTNYLIHEQPFRVVAKFDRIFRKYDNATGDTTAACEADRYYGMSPDDKILVRSFVKDYFGYPELSTLFLTEVSNGKTTEFPLLKGDSALVDFYNVSRDSLYQIWFRKNFEWQKEGASYQLKIKK